MSAAEYLKRQGRTLEPEDVGSRIVEVAVSADRATGAYLHTADLYNQFRDLYDGHANT